MLLATTACDVIFPRAFAIQWTFRPGAVIGLMMVSAPLKSVRALFPRNVGQSPVAALVFSRGMLPTVASKSINIPRVSAIPLHKCLLFLAWSLPTIGHIL